MSREELGKKIKDLQVRLTPAAVEDVVCVLMRQGEDVGGGVNAHRLVKQLLNEPRLGDAEAVWAYDQLKPLFRRTFEQIPSLYYFEGD